MSRRGLRAAGLDRTTVRRRVADGRLVEIIPDTFLLGVDLADAPPDLVRMAAVVSLGQVAALDGISALERAACWNRRVDRIHVSGSSWRESCERPPITYHRVSLDPSEVHLLDGIPTRSPIAALDIAAVDLTAHQLAFVIGRICYVGRRRSVDVIDELTAHFVGRRGSCSMQRALELVRAGSAGTKSATEDHLLPQIVDHFGESLVNVRGCTNIPGYEPDFCFPQPRVIIEIDGGHHLDDPTIAANDVIRDDLLRSSGWTIVRIPWRMAWTNAPHALRMIAAAHQGR